MVWLPPSPNGLVTPNKIQTHLSLGKKHPKRNCPGPFAQLTRNVLRYVPILGIWVFVVDVTRGSILLKIFIPLKTVAIRLAHRKSGKTVF